MEAISPEQVSQISGYLDTWENVSFDDKRRVVDLMITTIAAIKRQLEHHMENLTGTLPAQIPTLCSPPCKLYFTVSVTIDNLYSSNFQLIPSVFYNFINL